MGNLGSIDMKALIYLLHLLSPPVALWAGDTADGFKALREGSASLRCLLCLPPALRHPSDHVLLHPGVHCDTA